MIRSFALLLLCTLGWFANADFFVSPGFGVGYNSVQNTYYRLGVDVGYNWDENLYFGVGGYYAYGSHPSDDSEYGYGPFIGYHYPLLEFLSLELREDVDYVSEHNPYIVSENPTTYSHTTDSGTEFITYGGLHLSFTRNFGISGGYRFALGNSTLVSGRSGFAFGLTIGI